jgi:lysophospholipid acyltransferase (LPLAT)-like uncharacterized protein
MFKRLIRTFAGSFLLSTILAIMMGLLVVTLRWTHKGRAELKLRLRSGKPEIIIFWHEHLFVMSPVLPRRCSALQSPHPDGRVLAGASRLFGLRPIWGSSNRKALSGLRQMAGELKSGRSAVITPDGPRGPARTLSMGPISLAQLTGAPITIVAWSAQNCWLAKSWDKMRFPKPFSPITCKWSEPITLPHTKSKTELERQRLLVEAQLNKLVSSIDSSYQNRQVT